MIIYRDERFVLKSRKQPMSETKKVDVVFSTDVHYVQHFCVALTSLLENNLKYIERIFLLTDVDEKELSEKALSFIYSRYQKEVICLNISDSIIERFKVDRYISHAAYYRLFLSEVLPADVDKVLYLDSDLVVIGDLKSLICLEFTNNNKIDSVDESASKNTNHEDELYLYAMNEMKWESRERLQSMGLSGTKYFNSGVLLINLKKWRTEKISAKLISIALNYKEQLKWWDQDVLNIAFENQWGEINFGFNTVNLVFKEEKEFKKHSAIIHYTGSSKPWQFRNSHPLKNIYWHYLRKTPYRYYIPNDITLKNILYKSALLIYSQNKKMFKKVLRLLYWGF